MSSHSPEPARYDTMLETAWELVEEPATGACIKCKIRDNCMWRRICSFGCLQDLQFVLANGGGALGGFHGFAGSFRGSTATEGRSTFQRTRSQCLPRRYCIALPLLTVAPGTESYNSIPQLTNFHTCQPWLVVVVFREKASDRAQIGYYLLLVVLVRLAP